MSTAATPAAPSPTRDVLVLADGVELLGEYEDSGFREPPLLARRGDGQMIKLTPLLHQVAASCDGRRDPEQVAAVVSEHLGRGVSGANVRQLAESQLRPLGVLAQADGTTPELPKRLGLLSLRHRRALLRPGAVNVLAVAFEWLHIRAIKWLLLAAILVFDAWLLGVHGIAGGLRTVLYEPTWLLALLVSVVVATAFHEIGHASACRYSGARPGDMGVGLYLVWPAFYCDVTEAYRLNRRGRLRTDLGGVYFNGLFALGCGVAYFLTGAEALLFAAFVQNLIVLQQLLPLLRFDGYYVLSDLTGVPDILGRIKPIFRSLVRGRRHEPKVAELKPWVRFAVTAYLIVLIPALALMIGWILMSAPRTFATAYDSFGLQLDRLRGSHGAAELGVGAFRIAALVMPLAAMSLSVSRTAKMGLRGVANWSRGSVVRRAVAIAGVGAVAAVTAFTWWPDGDYEPIRPGEKGTVVEAVRSVPEIPSGRPSFTPQQAAVYANAPTERERRAAADAQRGTTQRDPETEAEAEPTPFDDPAGTEDPATGTDPDSYVPEGAEERMASPAPTAGGTPPAATAPAGEPAPAGTPAPAGSTEPTATPTPTPTSTATPDPSATASPTPTGTATPEQTMSGTVTPDPTALASPTPVPTLDATTTPIPTP
jgi:putative peptide zinc metalloprotease protein